MCYLTQPLLVLVLLSASKNVRCTACMHVEQRQIVLPVLQVAMLFRSHKDLLEEFTYFLPDAQAPAQVQLALPHAWHILHPVHICL